MTTLAIWKIQVLGELQSEDLKGLIYWQGFTVVYKHTNQNEHF